MRSVNSRFRRDVDNADKTAVLPYPEYLTFLVKLDGKKIRLELKLNRQQSDHVPVKLFKNGQFITFNDSSPRVSK